MNNEQDSLTRKWRVKSERAAMMYEILLDGPVERAMLLDEIGRYVPDDVSWATYQRLRHAERKRGRAHDSRVVDTTTPHLRGIRVGRKEIATRSLEAARKSGRIAETTENGKTYVSIARSPEPRYRAKVTTDETRPWTTKTYEFVKSKGEASWDEIRAVAEPLIPPGPAFRAYITRRERDVARGAARPDDDINTPERRVAAIRMGNRMILSNVVDNAVRIGRLERFKRDGKIYYRYMRDTRKKAAYHATSS
jgi:hypothetical protein